MPTYGYELRVTSPDMADGTRQIQRVEFKAPDRATAETMLDGWAAVSGLTIVDRDLIADGMTFLEAGKRRIVNLAADLSREFNASVVGPFGIGYDHAPGYAVRVVMRNGYGVNIRTGGIFAYDRPPVIEFATVYDDDTDVLRSGFPGAMDDGQRGSDDGSTDLEEIRAAMRKLPQT